MPKLCGFLNHVSMNFIPVGLGLIVKRISVVLGSQNYSDSYLLLFPILNNKKMFN